MFDSQSGTGRDESLFAEGCRGDSPRWSARRGRLAATRTTDEPRPGGHDELLGSGGARAPDPGGRGREGPPPQAPRPPPRRGPPPGSGGGPPGRVRGGPPAEATSPPQDAAG